MDPEIGSDRLEGHAGLTIPSHSNHVVTELPGIGLGHGVILSGPPFGQAMLDVPLMRGSPVERFNRTLQTEWAYRQIFHTNDERTAALAPWLDNYNTRRRHSALGGLPPISRLSPT